MALARADLESILRRRQLDRTLTTAQPVRHPNDEYAIGPTGVDSLDRGLDGGLPRGQLSELVGPRSSGRTSLLVQVVAAATRRGELVALIDALDMLDIASLQAAGAVLDRLLWIRGHVVMNPGLGRELNHRAMEQVVRAMSLVLQAGNFGLVALDLAEVPADAIRRLPFTTWLRLQRMVEGSQTVALLVGASPIARSPGGLTLALEGAGAAAGTGGGAAAGLAGLDIGSRIIRAQARRGQERPPSIRTRVHAHV